MRSTQSGAPAPRDTPEQLFARFAREGCERSFRKIYDQFNGRLHGWALRKLRDEAEAEDAAADTWVRVTRNAATYNPARPFSTWLFWIAANAIKNRGRNRTRRHVLPEADLPRFRLRDGGTTTTALDRAVSADRPETRLDEAELRAAYEAAFRAMKADYQEVFRLRYEEQLSPEEVARRTGLAEGSVRAKGTRARKRMRDAIGRHIAAA